MINPRAFLLALGDKPSQRARCIVYHGQLAIDIPFEPESEPGRGGGREVETRREVERGREMPREAERGQPRKGGEPRRYWERRGEMRRNEGSKIQGEEIRQKRRGGEEETRRKREE